MQLFSPFLKPFNIHFHNIKLIIVYQFQFFSWSPPTQTFFLKAPFCTGSLVLSTSWHLYVIILGCQGTHFAVSSKGMYERQNISYLSMLKIHLFHHYHSLTVWLGMKLQLENYLLKFQVWLCWTSQDEVLIFFLSHYIVLSLISHVLLLFSKFLPPYLPSCLLCFLILLISTFFQEPFHIFL